jgi:argininosuccinate lyase
LTLLINNLPSGYHRDVQLTKEILFPAIEELKACLRMTCVMVENMTIHEDLLKDEKYKYLFTVEAMNQRVQEGMSYREAYRQIGELVENDQFQFQFSGLHHTHKGSIGHLCLDEIQTAMDAVLSKFK